MWPAELDYIRMGKFWTLNVLDAGVYSLTKFNATPNSRINGIVWLIANRSRTAITSTEVFLVLVNSETFVFLFGQEILVETFHF